MVVLCLQDVLYRASAVRLLHTSRSWAAQTLLTLRNGEYLRVPRVELNQSSRFAPSSKRRRPSLQTASQSESDSDAPVQTQHWTSASKQTTKESPEPGSTIDSFRDIIMPRRPRPPAADECCMSGCQRCVYDIYASDLLDFQDGLISARDTLRARGVPAAEWPKLLSEGMTDTKEDARRRAEEQAADQVSTLDVSMREFLALERRIRKRNYERLSARNTIASFTAVSSTPTRDVSKPSI